MKTITDYFVRKEEPKAEETKPKRLSRARTRLSAQSDSQSSTHNVPPDSDSDEAKYSLRKIKIRLADPNVPDSYVCEVYDTSPSIGDDIGTSSPPHMDSTLTKRGTARQKRNLKRRRKKSREDVGNTGSSSDEALVFVRKRLKGSSANSVSSTKVVLKTTQRQSSEKENTINVGEATVQTRTSTRLVEKKTDSVDIAPKTPQKTPKKVPCYMKGRAESSAKTRLQESVSSKTDNKNDPSKSPVNAKGVNTTPTKIVGLTSNIKSTPQSKGSATTSDVISSDVSHPFTRARSVGKDVKLPDVKKETIEKWRNAIKKQCSRSTDESSPSPALKTNTDTPKKSTEAIPPQRRSNRSRTPSVKNVVKSCSANRASRSNITSYFISPTAESNLVDDDIQIVAKIDKSNKIPVATKTPIKECSVVLVKTPVKAYDESPTKKCSIVLEKLKAQPQNKLSSMGPKKPNLAPIFMKGPKKKDGATSEVTSKDNTNNIAPEVLKARQAFLQSGVPLFKRKLIEKPKVADNLHAVHFPSVSHVQQRCSELEWKSRPIDITLSDSVPMQVPIPVWKSFKVEPAQSSFSVPKSRTSGDHTIETLKDVYKNVKVDSIYQFLSERHDEVSDGSQELLPVWWEKYKPDRERIFCNERAVSKMTKWLTSWKLYNEEIRDGVLRRKRPTECSSDDDAFVSSDDEGRPSRAPVTACLLHGPASSGKTALVHSLANHLDLHILEINASSKRSGKKMLSDLQEATQSHKILQETNGGISRAGEKMSVIVVEEGDVVFEEQDDGFVFGLQSLIASAKRPVIIITSEVTSGYLEKFRTSDTLQICMVRPNTTHCCAVLEMICLLEGVTPSRSSIMRLLNWNRCDLRQSLLQLQFWGQRTAESSYPWPVINSMRLSSSRLWWASHQAIFKKDMWHKTSASSDSPDNEHGDCQETTNQDTKLFHGSQLLRNFLCFAENLSTCDVLGANSLPCELNKCAVLLKDSVSLEERILCENDQHARLQADINYDITERVGRSLSLDSNAHYQLFNRISDKEARWISSRQRASEELSAVIPRQCRNLAALDYLPALRQICRSEGQRVASNTKRGNRFYHYLRTLGGTPTQGNLQINCDYLLQNQSCDSKPPRKCGIF